MRSRMFLILIVPFLLSACREEGRLLTLTLPAPPLKGNLVGTTDERMVAVYLPPGYESAGRRYPVVYFLPAFGSQLWEYTGGVFQGFRLKDSMDRLILEGKIKPMLVVIPDGRDALGGCFYVNSPVAGRWEDFVTDDLIGYVDRNFQTIPDPSARGVSGWITGGSGAILLAMRHPECFGATYGLDPVLLEPGALEQWPEFTPAGVREVTGWLDQWATLPEEEVRQGIACQAQVWLGRDSLPDSLRALCLAYGLAFAPDPAGPPPYLAFPGRVDGPRVDLDPARLRLYEAGLGDWPAKIGRYRDNLARLRLVGIDVARDTEIAWVPRGAAYLSEVLAANGIRHLSRSNPGGHEDTLRARLEESMLPALSAALRDAPSSSRAKMPPAVVIVGGNGL